jgi:hypothetical protein
LNATAWPLESRAEHEVIAGHDTDTRGAYADRSAAWGGPHADPLQIVASPAASTATHDESDAHETALNCSVFADLSVHVVPFQVESVSPKATAQKPVVGHEAMAGVAGKACGLVGLWVVQVAPLNTRTFPEVVTAVHEVEDVHVTPIDSLPAGAVVGPQVVPL